MPNIGRTLFAAELQRAEAERERKRQDDIYFAEAAERSARVRAIGDEQRRKDLEAKSMALGAQNEALGQPQPELSDPGMRVTQRLGAGESRLSDLHAARQARAAEKLERLKQIGLVDRSALEHEFAMDRERLRGQNQLAASRARGPASVVNVGGQGQPAGIPLTPTERTRAQHDVRTARKGKNLLAEAEAAITAAGGHEAMSDYGEVAKAGVHGFASKVPFVSGMVSPQDAQRLESRAMAEAALADFSNEMLHERGGAVLPPAEYQRLKRSLPMIDDPAPVRRAKVQFWMQNYDLVEREGLQALMYGISTGQIRPPVAEGVTQPLQIRADVDQQSINDARELYEAGEITAEEYEAETGMRP